jgi:1-acyl-sn-glycerol-3-phosphate acyltransferase
VIWLRSLLFIVWFYVVSAVLAIAYVALWPFGRHAMLEGLRVWTRLVNWGLKVFAGVRIELRGREYMPTGRALVAAKHQGMFDTIGPFSFLPDACFVLKKELLAIPFYGWHAQRAGMIPLDREAGSKALKDMLRAARERLKEPRQVVIFPEGTRQPLGAPPDYKPGVAALYRDLGLGCSPMATNSGVHWPAHGFLRRPGTIVFEFLPPIPPGLKRDEFMQTLQDRIETASNRLLAEGL